MKGEKKMKENEFDVKPIELPRDLEGCRKFGNCLIVQAEDVDKAKEALLLQIHAFVDTLANEEKFWIVKVKEDVPGLSYGVVAVGWLLEVPQFEKPKIGKWVEFEPGKFKRE